MNDINVLIIIPARGGSKGIPRKNLRPVAGKPLIFYSIKAALNVSFKKRVVVSTDDDEIALLAERFGAIPMDRNSTLADDKTTLDPVIFDALKKAEKKFNEHFNIIVTIQPTSPLVNSYDIEGVVKKLNSEKFDSALTVVNDTHLRWIFKKDLAIPAYKERLNRQDLPQTFKETGAVIACTRNQIKKGIRIGKKVALYEVPYERGYDIDTISDLYLCEAMLSRKKVVFNVVGYPEVGLGHAYRAIMLANELVKFEILFVCSEKSQLAAEYIQSNNYKVIIASDDEQNIAKTIYELKPNMVINDILDSSESFMSKLKKLEVPIVNFEDMGNGADKADLVINALYPHQKPKKNVLVGPDFFCLRDEFLFLGNKTKKNSFNRILLTFGGVDEGNITLSVLKSISHLCIEKNLMIEVVTGPGYPHHNDLQSFISQNDKLKCDVIKKTNRISEHMLKCDIAFTSGGRTVLELASLKVPTIVICQNDRETTHTFASKKNGIINLGHRNKVSSKKIEDSLLELLENQEFVSQMQKKMSSLKLDEGKTRVINLINDLLN